MYPRDPAPRDAELLCRHREIARAQARDDHAVGAARPVEPPISAPMSTATLTPLLTTS